MLSTKEYESKNESGNTLNIDMYDPKEKDHFSPMETVLGALASCASVDLMQMIKKRKKTVEDLKIETTGQRREDEFPKSFTAIELTFTVTSPDLEQAELEKLVNLAATKYCSVAGSLNVKATHKAVIKRS